MNKVFNLAISYYFIYIYETIRYENYTLFYLCIFNIADFYLYLAAFIANVLLLELNVIEGRTFFYLQRSLSSNTKKITTLNVKVTKQWNFPGENFSQATFIPLKML